MFTGAAPQNTFWDLSANWSAGLPVTATTRALLGEHDSEVRRGSFAVGTLTGSGFLTVSGGQLVLHQPGSGIGNLYLSGGRLSGGGSLSARSFHWRAGELAGPALTVTGSSNLAGDLRAGASRVELLGASTAEGATLSFAGITGGFYHRGSLGATAGRLQFDVTDNAAWVNTGVIEVKDGGLRTYLGTISQAGTMRIADNGRFVLDHNGPDSMLSTGNWHIGRDATLSVIGSTAWHDFAAGTVTNHGSLRIDDPALGTVVSFHAAATLQGSGGVDLGRGRFEYHNPETLQLGWLRLAGPEDPIDHGPSTVMVAGGLTVDRLDWGHGNLEAGGPVTVTGRAQLSGWGLRTTPDGQWLLEKVMTGRWNFEDEVRWDGAAPISGDATIHLGAGARFIDQNSYRPGPGGVSARYIGATVENRGVYEMVGGGATSIGRMVNHGRVRVSGGSELTLADFSNHGSFEAIDSRINLGARRSTTLQGRYVMRNSELMLYDTWTGGFRVNQGSVVLDGAGSRQTVFANQLDNQGSLAALRGAELELGGVAQHGEVVVDAESAVRLTGAFVQSGDAARTWVDGRLAADSVRIDGGRFSAGLEGRTGSADLAAQLVSFNSGVLLVDIQDRVHFDQLAITGEAHLGGTLQLVFGDASPSYGVWRIMTAGSGVFGRFDEVDWGLDPAAYRVSVLYGADYVDLSVSAVPEPSTWALTLLGVLFAVQRSRRSRCRDSTG
ncbi:PEP-CTERM sorting domain-containing protein [Eleftheria terrae]|uniref:PEP-CTERM sorting domain-containing protein n=1 Tax=Eleftheria terrae TaxID=1597781 RepID=UPI00263B5262|nr:PEP-CTERM sorting domain-containing protein [Eleftheria terrae]WKB53287.1 PEP-CTERM sorting domain-containing protein [Eleftheria terrae]